MPDVRHVDEKIQPKSKVKTPMTDRNFWKTGGKDTWLISANCAVFKDDEQVVMMFVK